MVQGSLINITMRASKHETEHKMCASQHEKEPDSSHCDERECKKSEDNSSNIPAVLFGVQKSSLLPKPSTILNNMPVSGPMHGKINTRMHIFSQDWNHFTNAALGCIRQQST